jgi:Domain of unknown function (DUF4412)
MRHAFLALFLAMAVPAMGDVVIEQQLQTPDGTTKFVTKIKGKQLRHDAASADGPATVFMNFETGEIASYVHAKKTGVKLEVPPQQLTAPHGEAKATGKMEKIGSWNCEIFAIAQTSAPTRLWVTKEIPNYQSIANQLKAVTSDSGPILVATYLSALEHGVIVKVERSRPDATVVATVTKLTEDSVSADEFKHPEGYKIESPAK